MFNSECYFDRRPTKMLDIVILVTTPFNVRASHNCGF